MTDPFPLFPARKPVKGPGFRIDLDVRRVWRCVRCGRVKRTAGWVTTQRCGCADDGTWMQLQVPVKRAPFCPPPREPIPDDSAEPVAVTDVAPVAVEIVATTVEVTTVSPAEAAPIAESPVPEEKPTSAEAAEPVPESAPAEDGAEPFGAGVGDDLPPA